MHTADVGRSQDYMSSTSYGVQPLVAGAGTGGEVGVSNNSIGQDDADEEDEEDDEL